MATTGNRGWPGTLARGISRAKVYSHSWGNFGKVRLPRIENESIRLTRIVGSASVIASILRRNRVKATAGILKLLPLAKPLLSGITDSLNGTSDLYVCAKYRAVRNIWNYSTPALAGGWPPVTNKAA